MHYSSTVEKMPKLKIFFKMNLRWSEFVLVSRMFGLDINRGIREKHIYYGNWKLQQSYPEMTRNRFWWHINRKGEAWVAYKAMKIQQ